ncbi:MAG TPA: Ig domain-containing protein [Gammaproteobacteria bacterium]|nr:Ig domain-containing protein [Gammaproteobacteria bacterium]
MAESFTLKKPIPPQIVNEGAAFGPLRLLEFIESDSKIIFRAELINGSPLPKGLICTTDGIINGIPAADTQGSYKILITAINDETDQFTTEFDLTINPRLRMDENSHLYRKLKAEVWEALGKNLPLPDMGEILERPITLNEIYYLLQRFATLTIWDVYNLDFPGPLKTLNLEGVSKHYHVYDRGCCIVGAPIDLFSHERTLEDAMQTARAIAREVYKRGWVIEFAGFDKMVRTAWVELQVLGDQFGKPLEILHYTPTPGDVKIYVAEAKSKDLGPAI